jgi:hypothetical protein
LDWTTSVVLKKPRQSCPARQIQRSTQRNSPRSAICRLYSRALVRSVNWGSPLVACSRHISFEIRRELPNQLLKPRVADSELSSPLTTRWPVFPSLPFPQPHEIERQELVRSAEHASERPQRKPRGLWRLLPFYELPSEFRSTGPPAEVIPVAWLVRHVNHFLRELHLDLTSEHCALFSEQHRNALKAVESVRRITDAVITD